jgi:TRAP-type C4-dicarboxylate transport system permease small subunit
MATHKTGFFRQVIISLQKIEDCILSGLLLVMIAMAVAQIFLRNFFDSGILWGDELVRVLVLWIGLIGAMIASRNNHHISIDIISRYLSEKTKEVTTFITSLFTAVICGVMSWFSLNFVILEKQDHLIAFATVPAWICESIIPISFAIISIRYLILSFTLLIHLLKPSSS